MFSTPNNLHTITKAKPTTYHETTDILLLPLGGPVFSMTCRVLIIGELNTTKIVEGRIE